MTFKELIEVIDKYQVIRVVRRKFINSNNRYIDYPLFYGENNLFVYTFDGEVKSIFIEKYGKCNELKIILENE